MNYFIKNKLHFKMCHNAETSDMENVLALKNILLIILSTN